MQAAQSEDRFFGFIQIAEVCLPYLVTILYHLGHHRALWASLHSRHG